LTWGIPKREETGIRSAVKYKLNPPPPQKKKEQKRNPDVRRKGGDGERERWKGWSSMTRSDRKPMRSKSVDNRDRKKGCVGKKRCKERTVGSSPANEGVLIEGVILINNNKYWGIDSWITCPH